MDANEKVHPRSKKMGGNTSTTLLIGQICFEVNLWPDTEVGREGLFVVSGEGNTAARLPEVHEVDEREIKVEYTIRTDFKR